VGGETTSAATTVPTPTGTAGRVPVAAGRGGLGLPGRQADRAGGDAEQRQASLAQEAAAPEPYSREKLLVETLLQIRQLPMVHRHTNSPPFNVFLFRDLYEVLLLSRTVSGFHERNKVGGALVQVGLSGDRSVLDLEGERRAL
jgi:hypothetical protein